MDLSIIVVSYNTKALTLECLHSVYRETRDLMYEVLLVDNASQDGSADAVAERFPQVELIRLDENVGFAAANNLAAGRAQGEFYLLLNPDTVVLDGAVQKLHVFARAHPQAGLVGGRTLFPDGRLNPTSCWGRPTLWSLFCQSTCLSILFRHNRIFDPESLGAWYRDSEREVDIVTGCLLMIHRRTWEALGGFDPDFFMYGEDADLCLRSRALGCRPRITPAATIVHYGGASESSRPDKILKVTRARGQLLDRHWSPLQASIGVRLMVLGAGVRTLLGAVLGRLGSARWRDRGVAWATVWDRRQEVLARHRRPDKGTQTDAPADRR